MAQLLGPEMAKLLGPEIAQLLGPGTDQAWVTNLSKHGCVDTDFGPTSWYGIWPNFLVPNLAQNPRTLCYSYWET